MQTISDGSATFRVVDKRIKAMADMIYPVGAIYATAVDNPTLPFADIVTWTEVAQDRVLQGTTSGAGSTAEAGLPNITGNLKTVGADDGNANWSTSMSGDGAFYKISQNSNTQYFAQTLNNTIDGTYSLGFNASRSSSIYGNSNTVQPPALKVHFFQRKA